MDKKTILAVALSAIVLFGYQFYVMKNYSQQGEKEVVEQGVLSEDTTVSNSNKVIYKSETLIQNKADVKEIVFESDKMVVTLSNAGGCIKTILLKDYPDPKTGEYYKLFEINNPIYGVLNISGLEGQNWPVYYDVTEQGNSVIFKTQLTTGVILTKEYDFTESTYRINLDVSLENTTQNPIDISYEVVGGSSIAIQSKLDKRYTQIVSSINGKDIRGSGKGDAGIFKEGRVEYSGVQNKYFSVLTKPDTFTDGVWLRQTMDGDALSSIEISKFTLNGYNSVHQKYLLYAGPTNRELLSQYGLSGALSHGAFSAISNILLAGLKFFHRITRNWGVAIILLSIIVNVGLFPLSKKSYTSMKKMQELQPHIDQLRSEHKDNPQKLNKDIMELYKTYNLNPLGGCLPMVLQFPVFIALWQALMRSLELRGAHFLWIKDLSMPDAMPLPATLPFLGNSINILPILMTIGMFIQQKTMSKKNTGQSDQAKQQQQVMMLMPVIFLFVMYNFPSGLVIYWLTNICLTTFQQRAIMHT